MPDNELFRTVVQGGSFAVLVLILLYGILRLEPRVRETMEKKDALQAQTIQHMVAQAAETQKEMTRQFADACTKMMAENRTLMDTVIKRHDDQVLKLTQECKEERKEWKDSMVKELETTRMRMEKEGDLNRKSRHDFANQIEAMFGEVFMEGYKHRKENEEERDQRQGRMRPHGPEDPSRPSPRNG